MFSYFSLQGALYQLRDIQEAYLEDQGCRGLEEDMPEEHQYQGMYWILFIESYDLLKLTYKYNIKLNENLF